MARISKAAKIAEYDRRLSDEYRMAQHEAAGKLRELVAGLAKEQQVLLQAYLRQSEAEYQLVNNARFGGLCVEHRDTSWSCSVASDSYWQN